MMRGMPPRAALLAILIAFACAAMAADPSTTAKKDSDALEYHALVLPTSLFTTIDLSSKDGRRNLKPGVRTTESGNEYMLDVSGFLRQYGVTFPPGSFAMYDGVLVIRNTPANIALINRILGAGKDFPNGQVSVELSAYECTAKTSGLPEAWNDFTFAHFSHLPADSVKLIDRISINAKSGQRVAVSHINNPAGTTKKTDMPGNWDSVFHAGETGSKLELEALSFSSDSWTNLHFAYGLRLPGEAGHDGMTEVKFISDVDVWNDYPMVVYAAADPRQPGKSIVVVARTQSLDFEGWKFPEPKSREAAVASGSKTGSGPPPGMWLRIYQMPRVFLNEGPNGTGKKMDVIEYLEGMGVEFPFGSGAFYEEATSILAVVNTPANLELVDQLDGCKFGFPGRIAAELSVYQCVFPATMDAAQFTFADLEKLPSKSVQWSGGVSIVMKSGMMAVASTLAAPRIPDDAGIEPDKIPASLGDGVTGIKWRLEPILATDETSIDAEAEYLLAFSGGQNAAALKNKISFRGTSNKPQVVQVSPAPGKAGTYIVVVARMKSINPGGWEQPAHATSSTVP